MDELINKKKRTKSATNITDEKRWVINKFSIHPIFWQMDLT